MEQTQEREQAIGLEFNKFIDKDKTTENPGTLAFPHHVGSAVIKPEDQGKIKSRALNVMQQQTNRQYEQLYQQMQLLAEQANKLKKRVEISERIYMAEMRFEPLVGHVYHLYEKEDGTDTLSVIGPNEWGRSFKYSKFLATVELLADHTWEILTSETDFK
jgi:transcriptional regulator of heat shock response